MTQLDLDLKHALEQEYFLFGRKRFFACVLMFGLLCGAASWATMAAAFRATMGQTPPIATQTNSPLSVSNDASVPSDDPDMGGSAVPEGAILLMAKGAGCPSGAIPFANLMVLVNNNDSSRYEEALTVTVDSILDEGISWDARIFAACVFSPGAGGSLHRAN